MTNEPMSRENREKNARVFEIAEHVAEMAPDKQEEELERLCNGVSGLREEVQALLSAANECDGRAQQQTRDDFDTETRGAGERIGRYRLLQCIGEGGFGEVWMADQIEPVKRRVAVKLIKPGMDSGQIIARFEAERQALALMDHPNIARVLDAGTTGNGRLYFVMELVKGVPITEYCRETKLDLRERVQLMSEVCLAVQHAHQKGVIHRDLKPANVLVGDVDGKPVPKVIDFGVAKALERPLTDRTLFTEFRQFVGTPEYMSPEQADLSMIDVDTRSDVYALGVMLYELLVGTTPFETQELRSVGFDEMRRIIREDIPLSPSVRLHRSRASSAGQHGRVPEYLLKQIRLVRGELDWIVQKAIAKERDRRYASANDMADDLHRYLSNQPVDAGPPSFWYRSSRFVRRHRTAVAVGLIFFLALSGFIALILWDNARVHAAEQIAIARAEEAERERAVTQAINTFLNDDLLASAIPSVEQGQGREVSMRTVVDLASTKIGGQFPDQPLVEADIRSTLGRTYMALGILDSAEEHFRASVRLNELGRGPEDPMTLGAIDELTMVLIQLYKFEEAERNLRKLIDIREKRQGSEALSTLKTKEGLGVLMKRMGRYQEAEAFYDNALEYATRTEGLEHEDTLRSTTNLAKLYMAQGRFAEAEALLEDVVEVRSRVFQKDHPLTLRSKQTYASSMRERGKLQEALDICDALIEPYERVYGSHFLTYQLQIERALILSAMGRLEEATAIMREAVAGVAQFRQPAFTGLCMAQVELGLMLARLGEDDEAEELASSAIASLLETLGPRHPTTLSMRTRFAEVLWLQSRRDEVQALLESTLSQQQEILGSSHPETIRSQNLLQEVALDPS